MGPAASCLPWWRSELRFRQRLTINAAGSALPQGSWVSYTLDHAALVRASQSRADGHDVRIACFDGIVWNEVSRLLDEGERWNTADTTIWFRNPSALGAAGTNRRCYLFYGQPGAGAVASGPPPAILRDVQAGTARSVMTGVTAVTIPRAVRPDHSFLIFQTRHASDRPSGSVLRGQIIDASTIEFTRNTSETMPVPMDISWYVVEFASGIRVQRGNAALTAVATSIPLPLAVVPARTLALFSRTSAADHVSWAQNDPMIVDLVGPTTLQIRVQVGMGSTGQTAAWEVVEFLNPNDASVLRGAGVSMPNGTTTAMATLTRAVSLARSFVLAGFLTTGAGIDVGARMMRAELGAGTVTFERGAGGDNDATSDIGWQVLELASPTLVQSARADLAAGTAMVRATLPMGIDPSRTVALATVLSGGGANMGSSTYVDDDVIGTCSTTMALSASDVLIERSHTGGSCSVNWSVIQFPRAVAATMPGPVESGPALCPDGP